MVLCVDTISFAFVNYSSIIQEIVPVLEGYDFLLLVVIVATCVISHIVCSYILCVNISDCISNHIVREVNHESELLVLLRWLLHLLLMINHVS